VLQLPDFHREFIIKCDLPALASALYFIKARGQWRSIASKLRHDMPSSLLMSACSSDWCSPSAIGGPTSGATRSSFILTILASNFLLD
jgi:hypothetical protein